MDGIGIESASEGGLVGVAICCVGGGMIKLISSSGSGVAFCGCGSVGAGGCGLGVAAHDFLAWVMWNVCVPFSG